MENMALLMCGSGVLSFNSVADSVNFNKAPDITVLLFLACEKWWGKRGKTFCANRKNTDIAKIRAMSHSEWQCLKLGCAKSERAWRHGQDACQAHDNGGDFWALTVLPVV